MANQLNDNVYTTCFTPREYQVELLDAAKERNVIICLGTPSTKAFISIKLIQELANDVRNNDKKSVHLTSTQNVTPMATCLGYLTDLRVEKYMEGPDDTKQITDKASLEAAQIIVTTSIIFNKMVQERQLHLADINLMIIDDCHRALDDLSLRDVMQAYASLETKRRPRVLGLASSLFEAGGSVSTLEASIERLEHILHSTADTASDIVTLLRYSNKPHEMIVQCKRHIPSSLTERIREYVHRAQNFLLDHRYDPYEMYEDEFQEDLQKIPDPKIDPQLAFEELINALDTLGPWCADKAALILLFRIEKLKVKTPYERHFLLLCMAASILVQIRCVCSDLFEEYTELDRVTYFSAPKVVRLIELFRQLKPDTPPTPTLTDNTATKTDESSTPIVAVDPASHPTCDPPIKSDLDVRPNRLEDDQKDPTETNCSEIASNVDAKTTGQINHSKLNGFQSECTLQDISDKSCDTSANLIENVCDNSDRKVIVCPPELGQLPVMLSDTRGRFERPDRGRGGRRSAKGVRKPYNHTPISADSLCGIIFVQNRLTARVLHCLLCELSRNDPELSYITVQYTVDKLGDALTDVREMELEHRTQEEVLKRFRMHECNLLIATAILEEGIDVPRCNVVVHFDRPLSYRSYVHCKGRARVSGAYHVFIINEEAIDDFVKQLAEYYEIERILLRKCANKEPPQSEEEHADEYTSKVMTYKPVNTPEGVSVNLCTAVALLNRYCARLPSDTFTRLTPVWNIAELTGSEPQMYQCTVRLPINSPLKQAVIGTPMTTRVLARRMTALKACKALHEAGELDDNLMPIGKEGFRASEPDWDNFPLDGEDEILARDSIEPRPGTTKRRQYYNKKIAETLVGCRPLVGTPAYLYHIEMVLTCPLPEEQNTRGRRIYPPEDSPQGFGILTLKHIPKICSFPIFTRSGEVAVQLELSNTLVELDEKQLKKILVFLDYMFTSVLRLQKYLMMYDPAASEHSYFIVPTYKHADNNVTVDWNFLDQIYDSKDLRPNIIPEEDRQHFKFEASKYQDAVVMPWYRNQDQPQYFYVAEICYQLSPQSSFPGSDYNTFEEYYFQKYLIEIQNCKQPLLDVDHTSARLNFLTPRYVNRKGVALPTSSEETKRAKRENLEQKQILVPELCTIHPFPASLWRKAVCLPCILYRINALLLADEIRKQVAHDLGLGQISLDPVFEWPQLDFGWSLAVVLKKSNEAKLAIAAAQTEIANKEAADKLELTLEEDATSDGMVHTDDESGDVTSTERKEKQWLEIGTWSNEMADSCLDDGYNENAMCAIRYGSPTSMLQTYHSYSDEFDDSNSEDSLSSTQDNSDDYQSGLRIEFKGDNTAEAIEEDPPEVLQPNPHLLRIMGPTSTSDHMWNEKVEKDPDIQRYEENFQTAVTVHISNILSSNLFVKIDNPIVIDRNLNKPKLNLNSNEENVEELLQVESLNCNIYTDTMESESYCCTKVVDDPSEEIILTFSFDEQPNLVGHAGPSPSIILQALTMSNANDGINLERLETIGDSFLKYAITTYLYCTYENVHEGKLSHLRSKQVSNLNLYRLGRRKSFGESMIAIKFEPHDNWLPPCYYAPPELEEALIDGNLGTKPDETVEVADEDSPTHDAVPCYIPYNLLTQQSIPDKSVADCVEALIGAYLIECGPRGALLFMAWLGIRVLPLEQYVWSAVEIKERPRPVGSLPPELNENGTYGQTVYGTLKAPRSPLLRHVVDPEGELARLLDGYETFERTIHYRFRDRSYLLQSLTHASYCPNRLTDCYQRLEFLGDAVLDYLITRHLYEDSRQHSPGALTDLRSALVNNTIFASLAVRYGFHKFFRHLSPGLHEVVDRFVRIQEGNGHLISEEYYLIEEDECEEAEDVEVPKALGDVFESVAGAIFLDSGMSLDAVWRVYYRMMRAEIELFSTHVPKSPIRELLELEPETAKFGKPEKLADGRRVRVSVDVFGKGLFKGIGRNYRIAKCTAAKCALKQLKKHGLLVKKS